MARRASKGRRFIWVAVGAAAILGIAIGGWLWLPRRAEALTEKDTILIADFANTTGDAVFDDTLKQALAVDLGQSPFLSIVSDQKVRAALQQMTRPPGERLTEDTAREVCQRAGSKAYISGSIAGLGSQYVIGLNAINCAPANRWRRNRLKPPARRRCSMHSAKPPASLRGELGESLRSVQKFDVPLEQATTSSLEALKAFSLGRKQNNPPRCPCTSARSNWIRTSLRPTCGWELRTPISARPSGEPRRTSQKPSSCASSASEREKLSHRLDVHYWFGTGEMDKAIQTFTLWAQSYPRDWLPFLNLGGAYSDRRPVRKSRGGNSRIPAALSGQCDRLRESGKCSISR